MIIKTSGTVLHPETVVARSSCCKVVCERIKRKLDKRDTMWGKNE